MLRRAVAAPLAVTVAACGSSGAETSGGGGAGTGGGAAQASPSGWVQWRAADGGNEHWYGIYRTATTWDAAEAAATALSSKAYLVTITDEREQLFLVTTFLTGADRLRVFWMGGTGPNGDRVFTWVTGEPWSYTHWKSGEPNNWTRDEFYLSINWSAVRGTLGEWNDVPLGGTKGFDGGANDGPYQGIVESESLPKSL